MQLRQRIIDALGDEALTFDELLARLDAPPDELRRLIQLAPSFTEIGDRIAYVPALLDGTTWVVPVDADDATSDLAPGGFIRTQPHLGVIGWWLIDSETPAYDADGRLLGTLETDGVLLDGVDTDIITCEPGWLDAVAGGWAAVTVHDESVTIAPVDGPPEPTAAQAAAVAAGFQSAIAQYEVSGVDGEPSAFELAAANSVLHAAVLADRAAFRQRSAPPVDRLVAAAGLELHDRSVVAPGFDWDAYRSWLRRNRLSQRYQLADDQIDRVQMLLGACELHAKEGHRGFGEPSEWPSTRSSPAASRTHPTTRLCGRPSSSTSPTTRNVGSTSTSPRSTAAHPGRPCRTRSAGKRCSSSSPPSPSPTRAPPA